MSENKDKKTEDIVRPVSKVTDEELDNIAGGGSFVYQEMKPCPTPRLQRHGPLGLGRALLHVPEKRQLKARPMTQSVSMVV